MEEDKRWQDVFGTLTKETWKQMQLDAEELYKVYKNENDSDGFETDKSPMTPNMFFNLSYVRGFNNMNGYTYKEYIDGWKNRSSVI